MNFGDKKRKMNLSTNKCKYFNFSKIIKEGTLMKKSQKTRKYK